MMSILVVLLFGGILIALGLMVIEKTVLTYTVEILWLILLGLLGFMSLLVCVWVVGAVLCRAMGTYLLN